MRRASILIRFVVVSSCLFVSCTWHGCSAAGVCVCVVFSPDVIGKELAPRTSFW